MKSTSISTNIEVNRDIVYFIGNVEEKIVKIGTTKNKVDLRLKGIQTGNPHKLTVFKTIPGNKQIETMYHLALHKYNLNGEWFRLVPVVIQFCQLTEVIENLEANTYDRKLISKPVVNNINTNSFSNNSSFTYEDDYYSISKYM